MGASYEVLDAKVRDLFALFTQLRKAGFDAEKAWAKIAVAGSKLPRRHQDRLTAMLEEWETREGRYYEAGPDGAPDDSPPEPPPARQPAPPTTQQQTTPQHDDPPVIRRLAPAPETGGVETQVSCPECGRPNYAGELHCFSCGTMLIAAGGTRHIAETRQAAAEQASSAYFGDDSLLAFQVKNSRQGVRIRPGEGDVVIGRRSDDGTFVPDIDLAPFGAAEQGVSRQHAVIRRHGQTLVLADRGSVNHTYLNGQRLHAHEVRVLHNGDEVRFGQLVVRVIFQHD